MIRKIERQTAYALSLFALLSFTAQNAVSATRCESLFVQEETQTADVHIDHPKVFTARRGKETFVFKSEVPSLPFDLELADVVFKATGSKLFSANLVLDKVKAPSKKLALSEIPARVLQILVKEERSPYTLYQSRYIHGRTPVSLSRARPNEMRATLEEDRIFQAEAQRMFNWMRSHQLEFRGKPIIATVLVDNMMFDSRHRASRYTNGSGAVYWFKAGKYQFGLFRDANIVVRDGEFVLIDPW